MKFYLVADFIVCTIRFVLKISRGSIKSLRDLQRRVAESERSSDYGAAAHRR